MLAGNKLPNMPKPGIGFTIIKHEAAPPLPPQPLPPIQIPPGPTPGPTPGLPGTNSKFLLVNL